MNIAITGATGRTGILAVEKLLNQGHSLRALYRNPNKIELQHPKLTWVKGDVLDLNSLHELVHGTSLVFNLFGQVKGGPKDIQSLGTSNLVQAMKSAGVSRILSLSGGGLAFPDKDQPKLPDLLIRGIMKLMVPHLLRDAKDHAEVLKGSGLEWTIVRAPRLVNGPEKNQYRVGWVGVHGSTKISREDLANYLISQTEAFDYPQAMPFVSW